MRALVVAIAMVVSGAAVACSPSDITIRQQNWRQHGNQINLVGELLNNCPTKTMVILKAVLRMKSGEIAIVHDFLPAGYRKIDPGQTYAFGDLVIARDVQPDAMQISVIETR